MCSNDASHIVVQWAIWMTGNIGKYLLTPQYLLQLTKSKMTVNGKESRMKQGKDQMESTRMIKFCKKVTLHRKYSSGCTDLNVTTTYTTGLKY